MTDVISLTQRLVRIPSITALSAEALPTSSAALDLLQDDLAAAGFSCWRHVFEGNHPRWSYPVDNLYAEITLGHAHHHLCYLGHVDVVPVGDAANWRTSPFEGVIEDGYLYGRGTTDMKGSVAAFTRAALDFVAADNGEANIRLGILITTDEEWAAVNGTKPMLEWLKEGLHREPDLVLVGEPSSQDRLGTHIKVGRRGSLCGTLTATGVQGHAAYPALFKNPNRALSLGLAILNSLEWNDGSSHYPHSQFETVALTAGNPMATAVIPHKAEAVWNVRFTPQHTAVQLEARLREALAHPPAWAATHPDFKHMPMLELKANIDTVSIPYASTPSLLTGALLHGIETTLRSTPQLDATGGTTDGRFVQLFFPQAEVVEFGLPERGGIAGDTPPADYLSKGGMHQADERASVADLLNLQRIYLATLNQLSAAA